VQVDASGFSGLEKDGSLESDSSKLAGEGDRPWRCCVLPKRSITNNVEGLGGLTLVIESAEPAGT
jgi:hypothetical protein